MLPLPSTIKIACEGAILAAALRWLFGFDVALRWVLVMGVLGRVAGALLIQHLVPSGTLHSLTDTLMSSLLVVAVLGAAQLLHGTESGHPRG